VRFSIITISFAISTLSGFAQPDLSLVHFEGSTYNSYDRRAYVRNNGPLFHYQIINKSSDRPELELVRESDSSYYFIKYFPSGKSKLQGFLNIKLDLYYTPFIPDFTKDPDGSKGIGKDTVLSVFESGMLSYGWEYDSTGGITAGFRFDHDKTGVWYSGFLLKSRINEGSYFVRTNAKRYINIIQPPDSAVELNSITWPNIKGTWIANQEFSNDSLLLYHRGSWEDSDCSIEFKSEKKYYIRNSYIHGVPKGFHDWWTIGDRLFLKVGKSTHEYKIISFTGPELVIQLISVRKEINNEFL